MMTPLHVGYDKPRNEDVSELRRIAARAVRAPLAPARLSGSRRRQTAMTDNLPHKNGVFISVGNGLSASQEQLVAVIEALLRDHQRPGLTLGRNAHSDGDPLTAVRALIMDAAGVLVVAFARLRIDAGIEYPNTPHAAQIAPRQTCTVWNQLEAAMAFQAGKPLLVLADKRLHREGILDPTASATPVVWFSLDVESGVPLGSLEDAILSWLRTLPD